MSKIISWWSAGVTSAVATKLAIDEFGKDNIRIMYFYINTAHKDNDRFKEECEKWYDKEIEIWGSEKYGNQFDVIKKARYVNGPAGAKCSFVLKKQVRQKIEKKIDFKHQVFGFEYNKKEINRAIRFQEQNPHTKPLFPLIENKMTKEESLYFLEKQNIKRPFMYNLSYHNNNCIGCVKGGKGYWNKIRIDFPDTFNKMALLEREIGRSCINGTFLDELDSNAGRKQKIILPDCGNFCDLEFTDIVDKKVNKIFNNPKQLRLLYA
tara:strand:+ start:2432 stop:3226 length:795 start_codon:yes stop_codon:yes gene_type:complete